MRTRHFDTIWLFQSADDNLCLLLGSATDDEKKNPTGSGLVRENILGRTVEYYV